MFFKSMDKDIHKIHKMQEQIKQLQYQVANLIELLGFCGYREGGFIDADLPFMYSSELIMPQKDKQPATKRDFNMLLDHFGLEIKPEEKIPEKTIPPQLIKKDKKKE